MAKWVGTFEDWAEKMMMMGYKVDDLPGIAAQAGETFPKNLIASIKAKNSLFPGADMLYEYDLDNYMKRSYPHKNADYPEGTGYGEWVKMDPSEMAAQKSYYGWKENPANYGSIGQFGENPYNAWLANSRGVNQPRAANDTNPRTVNGQPYNPYGLGGQGQGSGTLGSLLQSPPQLQDLSSSPALTGLEGSGTIGQLLTDPNEEWKRRQRGLV